MIEKYLRKSFKYYIFIQQKYIITPYASNLSKKLKQTLNFFLQVYLQHHLLHQKFLSSIWFSIHNFVLHRTKNKRETKRKKTGSDISWIFFNYICTREKLFTQIVFEFFLWNICYKMVYNVVLNSKPSKTGNSLRTKIEQEDDNLLSFCVETLRVRMSETTLLSEKKKRPWIFPQRGKSLLLWWDAF